MAQAARIVSAALLEAALNSSNLARCNALLVFVLLLLRGKLARGRSPPLRSNWRARHEYNGPGE
jgi:hypothetical protein